QIPTEMAPPLPDQASSIAFRILATSVPSPPSGLPPQKPSGTSWPTIWRTMSAVPFATSSECDTMTMPTLSLTGIFSIPPINHHPGVSRYPLNKLRAGGAGHAGRIQGLPAFALMTDSWCVVDQIRLHPLPSSPSQIAAIINALDRAPGSMWPTDRSPRNDARPLSAFLGMVASARV